MKKTDIQYLGCVLLEDALAVIANFFTENGITCIGEFQPSMHFTLSYYGLTPDADRSNIPVADLGKTVELQLDSFGCYTNDGIIQNMGFRIAEDCLQSIPIGNGTLADIFTLRVPHITVAINPEKDSRNRVIAKAINTANCDFSKLETPLTVKATLAAFRFNNVAYTVED